jgi:MerR family transcriptional regulator, mercuric resistance operon regulatory protein
MDKSALHDTAPRLPIGALSKRTGCNIETIRYYEKIGLLAAPIRSEGGHRMYGTGHLMRLTFIRRARDLGFTLDEVRALLRLADERDRPCGEARDVAASHLVDVRAKIADLKKMARVLTETVARCADGTLPECPLIEVLFASEGKPVPSRGAVAS